MTSQYLMPFRYLLFILALAGTSCADDTTGEATVSIPPYQEFVLGAYEPGAFRAELENKSTSLIEVATRDADGEQTSGFGLSPGGKTTISVDAGDRAVFLNPNDQLVKIAVGHSQDVEGMSYQVMDLERLDVNSRLEIGDLGSLLSDNWAGTYRDWSTDDEEPVEQPCNLSVVRTDDDNIVLNFQFPQDTSLNRSLSTRLRKGGRQWGNQAVLSVNREGVTRIIQLMEPWKFGNRDALKFQTFRFDGRSLNIETFFQLLGSEKTRPLDAFEFTAP